MEFNNAAQKAKLREKKSLVTRQKLLKGANSIPHCGKEKGFDKTETQKKHHVSNQKKPSSNQSLKNGCISSETSENFKVTGQPKTILVKELAAEDGAFNCSADLHKDSGFESLKQNGNIPKTNDLPKTGMAGPELTSIFSPVDNACDNGLPGVGIPTSVLNRTGSLPMRQRSPCRRTNSVNRSKLKWYSHNRWSMEHPEKADKNSD